MPQWLENDKKKIQIISDLSLQEPVKNTQFFMYVCTLMQVKAYFPSTTHKTLGKCTSSINRMIDFSAVFPFFIPSLSSHTIYSEGHKII